MKFKPMDFKSIGGLVLKNGYVSKTHSGTISLIGQHFVEKGLLSSEDARMLSKLMNMRTSGDYTDFFEYTENDISPLFKPVEDYISKVKNLING
ncbi:MAG: HEPN domain-containing protein [Bacteroidales bacterium]|nr:HEPN domain-containing protein [Bacteroidales bacterium]